MSPTYMDMYDTKLPFGAAKSPKIFQRSSSAVCRILKKKYGYIVYLGDFMVLGKIFRECSRVLHIIRQLGFAFNWSKVEGLYHQTVFLGVVVDSLSMT